MNIFVCTSICSRRLFSGDSGCRNQAWFCSKDRAADHILGNYGFFHECDNDYAVIEESAEGPYWTLNEWWFKWDNKKPVKS